LTAVLPASGKNGADTGWVRFKLPIASDPGQIQSAVDTDDMKVRAQREIRLRRILRTARSGHIHSSPMR
jgi:hypothetical protein